MASGVADADFAGAVEGVALGQIDRGGFERGLKGVEIFDFDVEKRGAFADVGQDGGEIFLDAGVGLVHHFYSPLLKNHEGETVAVGDFDGFNETEMFGPEGENGFDFFDEEDGREFSYHKNLLACDTSLN